MTLDEPKNLFADSDKDTDRLIGRVLAGMSHSFAILHTILIPLFSRP